jgi:hypothetical protein
MNGLASDRERENSTDEIPPVSGSFWRHYFTSNASYNRKKASSDRRFRSSRATICYPFATVASKVREVA